MQWLGRRGLQWSGLLHLLFHEFVGPPPKVLVIHLGGNDLGLVKGKALILQAHADFQLIRERWPGTLIVWSAMVPRRVWRGALNPLAIDKARRKANRELQRILESGIGVFLPHPSINAGQSELYRHDGVHLSERGMDIFLEDLRHGLRGALGLPVGAKA